MKAIICTAFGGLETLVVSDVPEPPPPGADEVTVHILARGVSFSDLVMMAGKYQSDLRPPFVVGGEGVGEVTAVGADVSAIAEGDLVICRGGCVERLNVMVNTVTLLPAGVDPEAAASFRSNYATALYGFQQGALQAGETLLVHGAAGGVGLAAVDVGRLFGAKVIAAAGSEAKRAIVKSMGAQEVIDSHEPFAAEVLALTGDTGADVIYDPVGGDVFDESMHCVAPFGRILVVGFAGGRPALAKTNHLLVKDVSVIGFSLGGLAKHRAALAARNAETLLNWLAAGKIRPYVSHRVPLLETAEALRLVQDRQVIGKVIVTT